MTKLPSDILRRPKLPAGRATSPKLIDSLIDDLQPHVTKIAKRYSGLERALIKQPEIAIGLGLFESMHILDGGRSKRSGSATDLLEELD